MLLAGLVVAALWSVCSGVFVLQLVLSVRDSHRLSGARFAAVSPTTCRDRSKMAIHSLDGMSPKLPPDGEYWVAPTATVIGQVTLGRGVGIWFGAVLRGDGEAIAIGADTNLQDMVMVHTDPSFPATVGAGCTVGHRAIVHGCTIGDNVLIGMGAIVLNGARIGDNSLIARRRADHRRARRSRRARWSSGMPGKVVAPAHPRRDRPKPRLGRALRRNAAAVREGAGLGPLHPPRFCPAVRSGRPRSGAVCRGGECRPRRPG